jgi:hypothetical protein
MKIVLLITLCIHYYVLNPTVRVYNVSILLQSLLFAVLTSLIREN